MVGHPHVEAVEFLSCSIEQSNDEVRATLSNLPAGEQERMVWAMGTIEGLLGPRVGKKVPYLLRPHQMADMGWVGRQN